MNERFSPEDYDLGQYDFSEATQHSHGNFGWQEPDLGRQQANNGWQSSGQQPNSVWPQPNPTPPGSDWGQPNFAQQPNIHGFNQPHPNRSKSMRRQPRFNRDNFPFGGFGNQLDPTVQPSQFETLKHAGARIPFKFKCYPLAMYIPKAGEHEKVKLMECSNKIVAPNNVLQKICQYNVQSEHVYQINKKMNRVSIEIYYEYSDMDPMNDVIYVPRYIFEGLGIEYGDTVDLDFVNEVIPKGIYVKMQPVTNQIQEVDDYQTYMTNHLQSNYSCLVQGDTIRFPYFDDVIEMIIHELQPSNIVSITNTDLSVDFEPSVEQREKERQMEIEKAKFIEEQENKKQVQNDKLISFGKNMHKLNYDEINSEENYRNGNQEFSKHGEAIKTPIEEPKNEFVPFGCVGHSLSGKSTPLEPKMDTQKISKPNVSLRFGQPQGDIHGNQPTPVAPQQTETFQGEGNKLAQGRNVSMEEARKKRLAFLENKMKSKPAPPPKKETEPMDVDEEITKLIDESPEPEKKDTKKNKKYKFTLKKPKKAPKPDFLP